MFGNIFLRGSVVVAFVATMGTAANALPATCASLDSSISYFEFTSCTVIENGSGGNDKFDTVSAIVDDLFGDEDISITKSGSFAPKSGPDGGAEFEEDSDLNPGRDGFKTTQTSLNTTSFEFLSLPENTIFISLKQASGFELFGLFGKTVPFTLTHSLNGDDTSHISTFAGDGVSTIPLPAAGWMLLAVMGGLAGLRRYTA